MIEEVVSVSGKRYEELARWHDERIFRVIRHPQTRGWGAVLFGEWNAEAALLSRGLIVLCVLLGVLIFGWFTWRDFSSPRQLREAPVPTISKQPVAFTNRTFDPATPPTDMPPLAPGESAECDSDFLSNASVRGESRQTDATHATVTITQIKVTLQLNINIWVPTGVTQRVIEHEEGHRQISEYYYQTADKLAERIAATYMGRRVEITGTDLGAESSKMLQQMATDITDEYNKELNPGPTQLLYDAITDHGRNEVIVKDAVAHAIKNVMIESTQPTTNPGNRVIGPVVLGLVRFALIVQVDYFRAPSAPQSAAHQSERQHPRRRRRGAWLQCHSHITGCTETYRESRPAVSTYLDRAAQATSRRIR